MVSQFLHVHFHLNMTSRLSLNGGETWPTASILLSSELATPVSALVFARWIIIIEKDNDDDDDDEKYLQQVKSFLGDWTCDDCTAIMTRVADFMQQPETIQQGVGILTV